MDEIYEKYSRIVYAYLVSLNVSRDVAEELMQETFYSAVKHINKFKGESSIKTWLCRIAKNKLIDYIRKTKQENNVALDEKNMEYIVGEKIEDRITLKEEIEELYEKIDELDKKTKRVIYLRIRAELSFKEIGHIFNESENWARVTFFRGKIKVKEAIKSGR